MADSPVFIFYLLLYVVVTSTIIAVFSAGMGVSVISPEVNYTAPSDDSILSSLPVIGGAFDTASFVQSFIMSLMGVLFWTLPSEIMPIWANVVFIKIPLIALIISVVEVILP